MAHQGRPSKRKRTAPPASLPPGMMQPPPQFSPVPGLYLAQGFPQSQPHPPPPPYIHQTAPALQSHGFRPPPPPPPPYSKQSAPAVQAQAMYGQGFPPPYGKSPAPGLQAQAIYAQGFQLQQHAQGHPSVTGPSFNVGSPPVPPRPLQLNMAVLPRGPQIPAGQGQGLVTLNVKVPSSKRYLIIGKEHCMINWIQSKSGASIVIHGSNASETTFRINGQPQCVTKAKQLMDTAILEGKFTIDLGHPGNPPKGCRVMPTSCRILELANHRSRQQRPPATGKAEIRSSSTGWAGRCAPTVPALERSLGLRSITIVTFADINNHLNCFVPIRMKNYSLWVCGVSVSLMAWIRIDPWNC